MSLAHNNQHEAELACYSIDCYRVFQGVYEFQFCIRTNAVRTRHVHGFTELSPVFPLFCTGISRASLRDASLVKLHVVNVSPTCVHVYMLGEVREGQRSYIVIL